MKNAIIVHGTCGRDEYYDLKVSSPSNAHWLPWLQKQLLVRDILAQTPEMPNAYAAEVYEDWVREFERYEITSETVLVGHSAGAGFLVRWLSEHEEKKVGKVVLVAPWLDPQKEESELFYDFNIDQDFPKRTTRTTVMYSLDDSKDVHTSVEMLKTSAPTANFIEFTDKQHFCLRDLGGEPFPELLKVILE